MESHKGGSGVMFPLMPSPNRQKFELSKGRHHWAGNRQDYSTEPDSAGESSTAQWLRDGAQWVSCVIAACRWILCPSSNTSPTLPTPWRKNAEYGSNVYFCLRIYVSEIKEWKEKHKSICTGMKSGLEHRGTTLFVASHNVTSIFLLMRELP